MSVKFKLAILINPLAGLGGSVALKGSDNVAAKALSLGAVAKSAERMEQALSQVLCYRDRIEWGCAGGAMGADLLSELGVEFQQFYAPNLDDNHFTNAEDTKHALLAFKQWQPDLILFAGGDGTARDVYDTVDEQQVVLGVPAGVKIHSGVYGVSPRAAGKVVEQLISGELVSLMEADVMDIDEVAFRQGTVKAKRFGELLVPAELRYIQAVKSGGKESDHLVLADIAASVIEDMQDDTLYVMGSGSTVAAVMDELQLPNTLLGVDVIKNGALVAQDVSAQELIRLCRGQACKLIVTAIGGQGHILGRGNQQLSADFIKMLGKENIEIIATKTKLTALKDNRLLVDSGDPELDHYLSGFYRVTSGYRDYVMAQVANPE
ncbi:ATP-NAD kinase family protein [Paraferrimonas haliotis]|uniref:ATP-NAD kinase n=1 Tax=Paraferrimonas haliotis TaxID=2013866 RepID=A0AA37WVX5_9GAMM|nr:ATP-NAD kinase family protein [Paraferrimonas haliotis]GLS82607.1 ATP-NAD kinase [Paraferrimonas haliotis]